ncbi:MAG TPA: protein kinase [Bryobacteraceae bacterium]|jgi:serine/threonine-protein kinase|nr:protein kinase [Bryobacteraceae bacterium]
MDSARWEQVQEIFHQADSFEGDGQKEFLRQACGEDQVLFTCVQQMLHESRRNDSILHRGLSFVAGWIVDPAEDLPRLVEVGSYRLLRIIGEGGMGVVYAAEHKQTRKKVAVKFLVGAGMSPARLARFTHEIRMHADLAHPYIAAQYDASTLPDGTPFFVMEYIHGEHFVDYCRSSRASLAARLQLFHRVCEAVEYLHGKGIIHRDIKPSNILVDISGTPKVLDFGIAKELQQADDQHTRSEMRIGTRAYAAPEWLEQGIVDRATDVYSLGVIFFEMLAGQHPASSASDDEKRPSKLDTRLAGVPKAAWRELDKISQKALQRDPSERYRSVEALIRDLNHFLRSEPLEVHAPSLAYRVEKFAARNKTAVLVASVAALLLVGMAGLFAYRLTSERNIAVAEQLRLKRIQHFMLNMLGADDRAAAPSNDLRVLTLLDRASRDATRLKDDPQTQAELHRTLGLMYRTLGELLRADFHLNLAFRQLQSTSGIDPRQLADVLLEIAILKGDQAQTAEAQSALQHALALIGDRFPPGDPVVIKAKITQGRILAQSGAGAKAVEILRPLADLNIRNPEDEYLLSDALFTLEYAENEIGNYRQADLINARGTSLDRKLYGDSHPRIAFQLSDLASTLATRGNYPKAEALYRQAVDILQRWYGENQRDVLQTMTSLAAILVQQGKTGEAQQILQRVLAAERAPGDKVLPYYGWALDTLGRLELKQGELQSAESRFTQALAIDRHAFGDHDHQTAMVEAHLAQVLIKELRFTEAEPLLEQSLRTLKANSHGGNMSIPVIEVLLGEVLVNLKRYSEAESHLLAGLAQLENQHSQPLLKSRQDALRNLVLIYRAYGQPEKASAYAARLHSLQRP